MEPNVNHVFPFAPWLLLLVIQIIKFMPLHQKMLQFRHYFAVPRAHEAAEQLSLDLLENFYPLTILDWREIEKYGSWHFLKTRALEMGWTLDEESNNDCYLLSFLH